MNSTISTALFFESAGLMCTGENPETGLVEIVELPRLKWFVGTQYHPEYRSTVLHPNPLFMSFYEGGCRILKS